MWWNTGDAERKIPPLRELRPADFAFLDKKPKSEDELRRSTGKNPEKRRPTRKVFSDLKFLCTHIEAKALAGGLASADRSLHSLQRMCEAAMATVYEGNSTKSTKARAQNKWRTVVLHLRKKLKAERELAGDIHEQIG